LALAASNGAAPIITMLLDAGADVNGRDRHNDTALAMARRVNNAEIVTLLLVRGARE
jgi:ankyrin repeat protein